jgi:hypothetical protein
MLNGARKNLSNLVLNCGTYLWDKTLEVVSKPQFVFEGKASIRVKSGAYTSWLEATPTNF